MARGEQPLFSTPGDETEAGKMVKKMASFMPGDSETDDVVRRWLDRQGIDQALVNGYSIFRHQGEIPRITLEMYFDDAPVPDEVDDPVLPIRNEGRKVTINVSRETSTATHRGPVEDCAECRPGPQEENKKEG